MVSRLPRSACNPASTWGKDFGLVGWCANLANTSTEALIVIMSNPPVLGGSSLAVECIGGSMRMGYGSVEGVYGRVMVETNVYSEVYREVHDREVHTRAYRRVYAGA